LYPAGTKDLPLGTLLAILVEDEADLAAFKDYKPEDAPAPAAPV
jgi:pyruvate dehydrogenase E2 component (dihydrolipoamide acetyltransferase)